MVGQRQRRHCLIFAEGLSGRLDKGSPSDVTRGAWNLGLLAYGMKSHAVSPRRKGFSRKVYWAWTMGADFQSKPVPFSIDRFEGIGGLAVARQNGPRNLIMGEP